MLRSLVGSEMCIRDRYQRRVRGPRPRPCPTSLAAASGVTLNAASNCTSSIPRVWSTRSLTLLPATMSSSAREFANKLAGVTPSCFRDRGRLLRSGRCIFGRRAACHTAESNRTRPQVRITVLSTRPSGSTAPHFQP
eukprot:TRINITY_DN4620_c0_g1_i1.p3 TRINITY_DN4620_c0_g1~~TRINITY_DN4620_c0_g1_i1.p3  ORF type:complete len:137 (-),score=11.31 TRINITY_DN4620_c0_g1_i1:255-665(-)